MLTILPKDARLWSFWGQGWLCIPVTMGWALDGRGLVCGRLAFQLEERLPGVLAAYGRFCQAGHQNCIVYVISKRDKVWRVKFHDIRLPTSDANTGIILVPTRPLDKTHPELSWKNSPTWDCVRTSLKDLCALVRPSLHGEIYIPAFGLCDKDDYDDVVEGIEDELSVAKGFTLLSGEDDTMIPPHDPIAAPAPTTQGPYIGPPKPPAPPAEARPSVSSIASDFDVIIPQR